MEKQYFPKSNFVIYLFPLFVFVRLPFYLIISFLLFAVPLWAGNKKTDIFDGRVGVTLEKMERRDSYPAEMRSPGSQYVPPESGSDYVFIQLIISKIEGVFVTGFGSSTLIDSKGQGHTLAGWTAKGIDILDKTNLASPKWFIEGATVNLALKYPKNEQPVKLSFLYKYKESLQEKSSETGQIDINLADIKNQGSVQEEQESTVSLPENGALRMYSGKDRIAPLQIVTRGKKVHYLVKLTDWYMDEPVQTIFVRAGMNAKTTVPLGSYRLKYAAGESWLGEKELFGEKTIYKRAKRRFDFTRTGQKVSGYRVELILQPGGNLPTAEIPKSEW